MSDEAGRDISTGERQRGPSLLMETLGTFCHHHQQRFPSLLGSHLLFFEFRQHILRCGTQLWDTGPRLTSTSKFYASVKVACGKSVGATTVGKGSTGHKYKIPHCGHRAVVLGSCPLQTQTPEIFSAFQPPPPGSLLGVVLYVNISFHDPCDGHKSTFKRSNITSEAAERLHQRLAMDSSLLKHYHHKEFNPKAFAETYFCDENFPLIDECMGFPLKKLHDTFSSGRVRGDTMIDISAGPNIYQLLSASDIFKEIIVLETTEPNIQEFEKWLKKDPGAADWSYAAKALCELEGNREDWQVKEDKVRRAVKQVVKWDVAKDNPLDPVVLPQVDCVLSLWCLNHISRDKEAYRSNLRKITSLLKIGGHLLLFGGLNMTYYMIGEHRFFILPYDKKFLREALSDAGYVIENMDVLPSRKGCDLVDYEHLGFVIARKEREV
ncbi:nicotinamide N-methyltransferase-like [Ascaphus truei]|uniref:nicotinamide N-methyltransferase-like n=1 Tax=Ascaphus truei TaxID=8439 RepID=UPI003F597D67